MAAATVDLNQIVKQAERAEDGKLVCPYCADKFTRLKTHLHTHKDFLTASEEHSAHTTPPAEGAGEAGAALEDRLAAENETLKAELQALIDEKKANTNYYRNWHENNRERSKEIKRAWRNRNIEKCREDARQYRIKVKASKT
jgi:hypothetical protein